jgi:Ca-activated chloride channel family protein
MKRTLGTLFGLLILTTCGCVSPARAGTDRVTCTIELDRTLLGAGAVQRTVMKVALRAPEVASPAERPPVNLAVVLDRSGSMGGDKIERAKDAAIEALHRLGPRDLFSLVIYDHEVETVVPPQSAGNVEWIEGRIRKIQSRGNTALFAGVSQGAAEIRKNIENNKYVPRILLLSDGQANVGPSTPDDLGRLGAALMKEGIAVTTVGVGTDYNEDLMTRLSQASDGNAYFAAKSSELPRIFNAELGGVLKVVARRVVLEITCAGGVKPIRIIGREGRIRDDTVEILLNQLYGGQEKFALVEVEVAAARAEEVKDVAAASCRYIDAITQRDGAYATRAAVRFTRDEKAVAGSVNVAVQKDIAINTAAIANDTAISLNDAGKNALAAATLSKESDRLHKVAKNYNLPEVEQEAAELDVKSRVLSGRALNAGERKAMRTDSFQSRNQQIEQ